MSRMNNVFGKYLTRTVTATNSYNFRFAHLITGLNARAKNKTKERFNRSKTHRRHTYCVSGSKQIHHHGQHIMNDCKWGSFQCTWKNEYDST